MGDFSRIGCHDHPRNGEEWVYMHKEGKWYGVTGKQYEEDMFAGSVEEKLLAYPVTPPAEHMERLAIIMLAEQGTVIIPLQINSWSREYMGYSIYEVYPPLSEAELQELNK